MIYLTTVFLLGLILSWILTLHYQQKILDLQSRIAEQESDRIATIGAMSQEYESEIKKLTNENDMLRRRLG